MIAEKDTWLTYINEMVAEEGKFNIKDLLGNPIIIKYQRIGPQSLQFNQKIQSYMELLVQTYTEQELRFARRFPDAVANEYFLKPVAPLFQNGIENIDWKVVEKHIYENFQKFFLNTDFATFSKPDDVYFFVDATDAETGEMLGFIQFLINSDFEHGHIRACYFCVTGDAQERGVDKLLMGSIFKITPKITRIFLHTRKTNEKHIENYTNWGFKFFPGDMPNWPDFEYLTNDQSLLQEVADTYY